MSFSGFTRRHREKSKIMSIMLLSGTLLQFYLFEMCHVEALHEGIERNSKWREIQNYVNNINNFVNVFIMFYYMANDFALF